MTQVNNMPEFLGVVVSLNKIEKQEKHVEFLTFSVEQRDV